MPGNFNECLCSFARLFGPAKAELTATIDGLLALLNSLKALIQLFNIDLEDELRKIEYQAELAIIDTILNPVEAPINMILSYSKLLSDCPPVNTFTNIILKTKDLVLSPAYELRDEINQLLLALQKKSRQIEDIDKLIDVLTEFRDALDVCGES